MSDGMKHYTSDMRRWAAVYRSEGRNLAASDLECAADQMDKLIAHNEAIVDFIKMLKQTVDGGGRVVTFQDIDVDEMKRLTGE